MYIRKSIRSYGSRTYTNYVLVESVQTPKGPRQKTVCSLGDLGPRPRAAWLELARKIEDALIGQGDLIETGDAEVADIVDRARERRKNDTRGNGEPRRASRATAGGGPLIKVDPSRVSTELHREAGPVHVGHQFWRRLELDRILRDCKLPAGVRQLTCVMTLNRLIAPSSEHAMPAWIRRTALADILGIDFEGLDEQPLYRVLDKLRALKPRRLKTCVLLDKAARRVEDVKADYVGFEIPDFFVVGYGLDFAERYRNLPFVGVLYPRVYKTVSQQITAPTEARRRRK